MEKKKIHTTPEFHKGPIDTMTNEELQDRYGGEPVTNPDVVEAMREYWDIVNKA